ncbi:putative DNA-binding transcriptional regulator YafY [Shimia isoporae]|uniref:Putative DNA-binding transcriptional regulator YafY n=1 Tax=Shimia isoporae TaxID=647720 RepID=A0A4R1NN98_9RHOB|nr:HTH domain-containing protein [Shimia isoporae]TCL09824.1 putative DNA-binding transcriptional regulator YafY [Shimia isoporae]
MPTKLPSKRSERLYSLVDILKDGALHRAEDLASRLEVSLRTIYRDMETLIASGVPIEGERGAGYRASANVSLPPLNLTNAELEALHIGLAVVGNGMEGELREAAESLSAKIDSVLPEDASSIGQSFGFAVYPFADAAAGLQHLEPLRSAIRSRQKLALDLKDDRTLNVRPLKIDYWGRIWSLLVWSETDNEFAQIRVDRIGNMALLPGLFVDEPGKRLQDFQNR